MKKKLIVVLLSSIMLVLATGTVFVAPSVQAEEDWQIEVVCDFDSPQTDLCNEEVPPGTNWCIPYKTVNLMGKGVACHPKFAYISQVTGEREVLDFFYSCDSSNVFEGECVNTSPCGWRACTHVTPSGNVVQIKRGYLACWFSSPISYGPWHPYLWWDSRCPKPINVKMRYDPNHPYPPND